MQIKRFQCSRLNAFLNYEFTFHSDVTFLHGINGSGKTSVLRAIASLLTPDPVWLFSSVFDRISISLEHHGLEYTIQAENPSASSLVISISGGIELIDTLSKEEILPILKLHDDDWRAPPGVQEEHSLRTKHLVDSLKTFSFISSLPTPIFLGLDRTTLSGPLNQRSLQRGSRGRTVSPYFRTSLDEALYEAERLLVTQLASLSAERNSIFETLRNQFVLSLFQLPGNEGPEAPPNKPPIARLQRMRSSVTTALKKISIASDQIEAAVEPFFESVFVAAEQAERAPDLDADGGFQAYIDAVSPYMTLRPSISIIERAVEKIEEANKNEAIISRPIEIYTRIMNSFFEDSRKAIVFEQNFVRVKLPSGKTTDITALSSGERQIFVLITHLLFNPSMRDENLLLIDEPELSLHLKWQRHFVRAIRTASPSIQMVLATHSPEIIFDLEEKMIALEF